MKYLFFCLSCLIFISVSAQQTRKQDENAFLKALTKLSESSKSQHWAYEVPFTVDSTFHIIGDTLTATFKFTGDSTSFRIRYAAPIAKIKSIDHDVYLILSFSGNYVNMYEQENGKEWIHFDRRNIFHIAEMDTDNETQAQLKDKIEAAWQRLKGWYLIPTK